MLPYAPSELILNPDGSVYHLGLRGEDIPELIFTVGDPERVSSVSKHFEQVYWTKNRREFKMVRGSYKGNEVLVMSTGMGTDNIDIVVNELDAAVNIDPEKRTNRATHRKLRIIRIGTSGAVNPEIPVGSHLWSAGALAFDALLPFYQHDFEQIAVPHAPLQPYVVPGSSNVPQWEGLYHGITATLPGFYGPQGRNIRIGSTFAKALDGLHDVQVGAHTVTNFEMETSGIYALAHLLGHEAHSFSALLANRATGDFHPDPSVPVESLIQKVLEWAVA